MSKIKEAMETLREAGYYVDNLWSVDDVDDDNLSQEEKLSVLHDAIHRDRIYEIINENIYDELMMRDLLK